MQLIAGLPNPSGRCPKPRLDWNSPIRQTRFPSVEERICLYMTQWYDPDYGTAQQWKPMLSFRQEDHLTLEIYWNNVLLHIVEMEERHLMNDVPFFVTKDNQTLIKSLSGQKHWILFVCYGRDTENICKKFNNSSSSNNNHPLLFVWGDQETKIDVHLPIVGKWRFNNIDDHTRPAPILLPLDYNRHYGQLKDVKAHDIAWENKKNEAVWRGGMTGIIEGGKFVYNYEVKKTPAETCLKFERCRLVYRNQDTVGSDIGFSSCQEEALITIEGVHMMRPVLTTKEQLEYKMLISIEGNDVATGLKWNLLSSSVVLMPRPMKSIFSMEFLLEPWVHYVPLDVDNIGKAIQWVLEHDEEAQRISQRATNFIEDLFLHPDSEKDNDDVAQEIANRITALWAI